MTSKPEKSAQCLNCGHPLEGENFCPNCGQKNDVRRLTLSNVLNDSISNLLAFDGRFFHTLINLFRHPGKVPGEFIQGKRTRYMNPVRLYFLSSILLLFIVQVKKGGTDLVKINRTPMEVSMTDTPGDTAIYRVPRTESSEWSFSEKFSIMRNFYDDHRDLSIESSLDSMRLPSNFYHRFLYSQVAKISDFDADAFNKYLFSKLFWVLFFFLPILALLLKLLYIRRPFFYPEHLFFTFYLQSVFFILLAATLVWPIGVALVPIAILYFAVYLYLAMKQFYKQGTAKTILKFVLLNLLIIPSFTLFFGLSTLIAFILF